MADITGRAKPDGDARRVPDDDGRAGGERPGRERPERPGRSVLVRVRPALARPDDPTFELARERRAANQLAGERRAANQPALARVLDATGTVGHVEVVVGGWRFELEVEDGVQAALREKARRGSNDVARHGPVEVRAIIPGRVVSVDIGVGDRVEAGRHLLVLEAMKMQNELRAPAAGRIARIAVTAGATVDRGDLLLVIEPSAAPGPADPNATEPGA
ncbi:MAG: biotin/lipoyl-binding protein [Chloroflexi bacterium]|nr:biotin/lipoyl-binding protein [Chloroflexota bacterium]